MKFLLALMIFAGSVQAFAGEVEIKVSGMVCSLCSQGIKKKFSGEKAVKEVHVDMDKKFVHLITHDGQDITDERVNELITEAGYNVAEIKRK